VGRLVGHLVALLTTLKGLPSSYNKDLQEDKEPLFDALDTLKLALPVAAGVVRTLKVNAEAMAIALDDAMLTTDLADYLVRRGVPFRQSHELVGQAVRRGEALGLPLRELPLAEFQAISEAMFSAAMFPAAFESDLYAVFNHRRSVDARDSYGGTATAAVRQQIERAWAVLREQA